MLLVIAFPPIITLAFHPDWPSLTHLHPLQPPIPSHHSWWKSCLEMTTMIIIIIIVAITTAVALVIRRMPRMFFLIFLFCIVRVIVKDWWSSFGLLCLLWLVCLRSSLVPSCLILLVINWAQSLPLSSSFSCWLFLVCWVCWVMLWNIISGERNNERQRCICFCMWIYIEQICFVVLHILL